MNIKVVGIGGIGGALLPILCRFLAFRSPGARVSLIDGDQYEQKNQERQVFDRPGNKAEVTVGRLVKDFPSLSLQSRPEYLHDGNIVSLIREDDVVLLCVDNHATRKLVSDRGEELDNCVIISGGNEYTDGSVQIFWRREGTCHTLPLANDYHPEIRFPKDKNPGEIGCLEATESTPQLLITNNAIAAVMLSVLYAHLENRVEYDEVYVDILTGNSRGVRRSTELAEK
ncbi:MAG TPA: ThiF family adenylyltransferase [Patescibacteria group bacterium]|nr:ThiF family adenylyltransferase [Patescibacteria group bacterium]